MDSVVYRTVADSAALEDAMKNGTADVVWRGLSAAAITRYTRQVTISDDEHHRRRVRHADARPAPGC